MDVHVDPGRQQQHASKSLLALAGLLHTRTRARAGVTTVETSAITAAAPSTSSAAVGEQHGGRSSTCASAAAELHDARAAITSRPTTMKCRGRGYVYSENPIVSRILASRGWSEVRTPDEADVVWTVRGADIDWNRVSPRTLCNHFDAASPLTTKASLSQCLRAAAAAAPSHKAQQSDQGPPLPPWEGFFPRSYSLSEEGGYERFVADMRLTAVCSVLKRSLRDTDGDGSSSSDVSLSLLATAVRYVVASRLVPPKAVAGLDLLECPKPSLADLEVLCLDARDLGMMACMMEQQHHHGLGDVHVSHPADARGRQPTQEQAREHAALRSRLQQLAAHQIRALALHGCRSFQHLQMESDANVWILKPAFGSKGKGHVLVAGARGLRQVGRLRGAARVAQKYVERPLLLNGCKFDIRLYVLCCGWAPQGTLWLYDEMILKVCQQPFCLRRLGEPLRHLTNCSVQRGADGGNYGGASDGRIDSLAGDNHGDNNRRQAEQTLWSSRRFSEHLRQCGHGAAWEASVLPQIAALVQATFASVDHLSTFSNASSRASCDARPRSFEVFGVDVILDETLRPWLLEVNESPNLRDHGQAILVPMLSTLLDHILALDGENPAPGNGERALRNRSLPDVPSASPRGSSTTTWRVLQ